MRQRAPVTGEYVRALRFTDQTYVCDHDSALFPRSASEPAWRFVADESRGGLARCHRKHG